MATASGAIPPGAPDNDGAATAVIAAWRDGPEVWRAITVAGLMVGPGAAVAWWGTASTHVVVALVLALVPLTIAALVDVAEHRLPNALVAAAAVPVVAAAAMAALGGGGEAGGALLGAALCGGPLLATHLVSPSGLGFGDVKAATVVGAALGLISPVVAVAALVAALATTAFGAIAGGRRAVAFGPGLVVGAAVALAWARLVGVRPW